MVAVDEVEAPGRLVGCALHSGRDRAWFRVWCSVGCPVLVRVVVLWVVVWGV